MPISPLLRLFAAIAWFGHAGAVGAASLTTSTGVDIGLAPTNAQAASIIHANQLAPGGALGLNLTGAGVSVGVWDPTGAVLATHQELVGKVTVQDGSSPGWHATHVAGTIAANGVVAAAHGMAPGVQLASWDTNNFLAELSTAAGSLNLSNHSYGYGAGWEQFYSASLGGYYDVWLGDRSQYGVESQDFGKYDGETRELDRILAENPHHLSVWSAGNEVGDRFLNVRGDNTYVTYLSGEAIPGWYWVDATDPLYTAPTRDGGVSGMDTLTSLQVAKNSVVVGAVADTGNTLLSFSSRGPTDDGRLGVTVVANGASLYSSYYNSAAPSNLTYANLSGTSMAAPGVTGAAALLTEHYNNLFNDIPLSSTTKALLAHTAVDKGNVGPDYSYGYGLVDAAAAADFLTAARLFPMSTDWLVEENYQGTEWTQHMVSDGSGPITATLAWTDPAPAALADPLTLDDALSMLVNDLDLWITDSLGAVYYPWTLDPLSPLSPAVRNAQNHVDNLVQVQIDLPAAGDYVVHVGDSRLATTRQGFSLLVSGAYAVPEPGTIFASLLALLFLGGRMARHSIRPSDGASGARTRG